MDVKIEPSWKEVLANEFSKDYFVKLTQFVKEEYSCETPIYPPAKLIFNAFDKCPFDKVKVVILGQDPYHGVGQAHGLCFSVNKGIPFPPSLLNIFKEIESDMGTPIPEDGDLTRWSEQGVLLLNNVLTVRKGEANMAKEKEVNEVLDKAIISETTINESDNIVEEVVEEVEPILEESLALDMDKLSKDKQLKFAKALGLDDPTFLMVKKGIKSVEEELYKAQKYTLFDEKDIQTSVKFEDTIKEIGADIELISKSFSFDALPQLQKFSDKIRAVTNYLSEHPEVVKGLGLVTFSAGLTGTIKLLGAIPTKFLAGTAAVTAFGTAVGMANEELKRIEETGSKEGTLLGDLDNEGLKGTSKAIEQIWRMLSKFGEFKFIEGIKQLDGIFDKIVELLAELSVMFTENNTHLAGRDGAVRENGHTLGLSHQRVADNIVHDGAVAFLLLQREHHVSLGVKAVKLDIRVVFFYVNILHGRRGYRQNAPAQIFKTGDAFCSLLRGFYDRFRAPCRSSGEHDISN